jgi:RsiW-degrading membrane proteinase PrsW (M82 family)
MGNTFFYQDVKSNPTKITWKEILSEAGKKHSKAELEYALSAGTSVNTATEENMLRKWHKPWLFAKVGTAGLILVAIVLAVYVITYKIGEITLGIMLFAIVIPPLVIPISIMLFIWELNIPKNLSLYELLACFVVGGILSIGMCLVFFSLEPSSWTSASLTAPVAEEPAKLFTSLILILFLQRNRKMHPLTFLAVGAAVGAGFTAFESAQYAFTSEASNGIYGAFQMFFEHRLIGAFSGHTLYCATYTGALGLGLGKKGKLDLDCFKQPDFWAAFAAMCGCHALWNANSFSGVAGYAVSIAQVILHWFLLLYVVKKCLYYTIAPRNYQSGSGEGYLPQQNQAAASQTAAKAIQVVCVSGALQGASWRSHGNERLIIGREDNCQLRYQGAVPGISRNHCSIQMTRQGWTVQDLNSTYGTYLNGRKLMPGAEQALSNGDTIALGSGQNIMQIMYF